MTPLCTSCSNLRERRSLGCRGGRQLRLPLSFLDSQLCFQAVHQSCLAASYNFGFSLLKLLFHMLYMKLQQSKRKKGEKNAEPKSRKRSHFDAGKNDENEKCNFDTFSGTFETLSALLTKDTTFMLDTIHLKNGKPGWKRVNSRFETGQKRSAGANTHLYNRCDVTTPFPPLIGRRHLKM